MPISYRSTGTGSTGAASTSITTTTPAGVVNGDCLVWTLALNAGTLLVEPPVPAGWQRLVAFQVVGAGPSQASVTWFRYASAEPANYTISGLASGRYSAHIHAFPGVDTVNLLDVASTLGTSTTSEVTPNPAITPLTPGAWILAEESDSTASGVTTTTYSSSNANVIGTISSTSASTINAALGACYLDTWTSGSFTPNLVPTGTIARATAATIVLRAASVVDGPPYRFPPSMQTGDGPPFLWMAQQYAGVDAVAAVNPDIVFPTTQRRTLRGWMVRRGRRSEVVPPQVVVAPPAFIPQATGRRSFRSILARRGRTVTAPPAQQGVLNGTKSTRRIPTMRRRNRVEVVPPQQAAPVNPVLVFPASQRRTFRGMLARRGRRSEVVPPQVVVTPPAYVPQGTQGRDFRVLLRRKPRRTEVTPQQGLPLGSQRRTQRPIVNRRGRRSEVIPPQTPVPPTLVHKATQRRTVRGWLRRRFTRTEPVITQTATPVVTVNAMAYVDPNPWRSDVEGGFQSSVDPNPYTGSVDPPPFAATVDPNPWRADGNR